MRTRAANIREFLDSPDVDSQTLARNLQDIRRINALLGWRAVAVQSVAKVVRQRKLRAFSLLDLASGSADMPLAIARWSRKAGLDAHIVATDISPDIVAAARKQAGGEPRVQVEQQDALDLPYTSQTFDIVLCTLALHHFDPDNAVRLLRSMARVGRVVLVFDVVRSPLAYWGAVGMTTVLCMHPMTRHDAPISVRRAYSAPELHRLAELAGLPQAEIGVSFPFRLALTASCDPY